MAAACAYLAHYRNHQGGDAEHLKMVEQTREANDFQMRGRQKEAGPP